MNSRSFLMLLIALSGQCLKAQDESVEISRLPDNNIAPSRSVNSLYATNRAPLRLAGPLEGYSSQRVNEVEMGIAVVTIPPVHMLGRLELAPALILEKRLRLPPIRTDPTRYLTLRKIVSREPSAFYDHVKQFLRKSANRSVLLYIPDRESFNEAAFRSAQIAYDLQFSGASMFYSWASSGALTGYMSDVVAAGDSSTQLESVLSRLWQLGFHEVHIIAVGTGGHVLLETLRDLQLGVVARPTSVRPNDDFAFKFRNLVFVAPDVSADLFVNQIPKIKKGNSFKDSRLTVYSAPNSALLRISEQAFGSKRLGNQIVLTDEFDQIVVSMSATPAIADSSLFWHDLSQLIRRSLPPDERVGLTRRGEKDHIYWSLAE